MATSPSHISSYLFLFCNNKSLGSCGSQLIWVIFSISNFRFVLLWSLFVFSLCLNRQNFDLWPQDMTPIVFLLFDMYYSDDNKQLFSSFSISDLLWPEEERFYDTMLCCVNVLEGSCWWGKRSLHPDVECGLSLSLLVIKRQKAALLTVVLEVLLVWIIRRDLTGSVHLLIEMKWNYLPSLHPL